MNENFESLVACLRKMGYELLDASVYGNAGMGMAKVFHRTNFVQMAGYQLDEIMNVHNAYCLFVGDKLFVVFK